MGLLRDRQGDGSTGRQTGLNNLVHDLIFMSEKLDSNDFWNKFYLSECFRKIEPNSTSIMIKNTDTKNITNSILLRRNNEIYMKTLNAHYVTEDLINDVLPLNIKMDYNFNKTTKRASNTLQPL